MNYASEEGVMEFYHRLEHYAVWMVRPPDIYTFKKHYMLQLPKNIFNHLLQKEVTPKFSTMFYTMQRKQKKSLSRQPDIGMKGGVDRHRITKPEILPHENRMVKATPHVTHMATISFNRNLNGRTTGNC